MSEEIGRRRVLMVDDDEGLCRLVAKRLERLGMECVAAHSGKAGLAMLDAGGHDLLLVDLALPDLSGKELVAQMRGRGWELPFIVITGHGDERVAVELMKQGALDYLVKDGEFLESAPRVVERALRHVVQARRLREAEEAFRREHLFVTTLLSSCGALVMALDPAGRIVRVNSAFERALGCPAAEAVGGDFLELLYEGAAMAAMAAAFRRVVAEGRGGEIERRTREGAGGGRVVAWSFARVMEPGGGLEYVVATGLDLTELRDLEREILGISERERLRIGQDLHDGICQQLAGIEYMSQLLEQRLAGLGRGESAMAGEIARLIRRSISQTKDLARGLSPVHLESEGLMAALEGLARSTREMFRVECEFVCRTPVLLGDHAAATHLFRIAQEAVANGLKHGRARHIRVTLAAGARGLTLEIRNDGERLPETMGSGGMGLRIMSHRAAALGGVVTIRNGRQKGVVLTYSGPFTPPDEGGAP